MSYNVEKSFQEQLNSLYKNIDNLKKIVIEKRIIKIFKKGESLCHSLVKHH
jgi:hypothetical protein